VVHRKAIQWLDLYIHKFLLFPLFSIGNTYYLFRIFMTSVYYDIENPMIIFVCYSYLSYLCISPTLLYVWICHIDLIICSFLTFPHLCLCQIYLINSNPSIIKHAYLCQIYQIICRSPSIIYVDDYTLESSIFFVLVNHLIHPYYLINITDCILIFWFWVILDH